MFFYFYFFYSQTADLSASSSKEQWSLWTTDVRCEWMEKREKKSEQGKSRNKTRKRNNEEMGER